PATPRRSRLPVSVRWMPMPRVSEARKIAPAAIIVVAATLLVLGFGVSGTHERSLRSEASEWQGLVGGPRPPVPPDQRMLVVLKSPSLAQRVARNGGFATQRQEHEWTRAAIASQKQLLALLSIHGILVRADFSFARVLNGFSAALDARAVALLERQQEGAGGPGGISGVATGASVLPIRVAGWQRDLTGSWAVFARSDQLIAGLERAVDPNLDGDAHDAARIALVGVAAPYAAFTDSPEARAVKGALQLDTLVVAPAGNDGPAGPGYGSIASPGGAPAALTAGAADVRTQAEDVPGTVRTGLRLRRGR